MSVLAVFAANSQLHAHPGCPGCVECTQAREVLGELVDIETIAPDDAPDKDPESGDVEDE